MQLDTSISGAPQTLEIWLLVRELTTQFEPRLEDLVAACSSNQRVYLNSLFKTTAK